MIHHLERWGGQVEACLEINDGASGPKKNVDRNSSELFVLLS